MTRAPVVKVGGSLFALPDLRARLCAFCATFAEPCLLVAGGGPFADAVRDLDRLHALGESAAHRIAVASLAAGEAFLAHLVGDLATVVNAGEFLAGYERECGPVPATWGFTTDSIAAIVAYRHGRELVLLKSITIPPGTAWSTAAELGWVDPVFPELVTRHGVRVTAINLRSVILT